MPTNKCALDGDVQMSRFEIKNTYSSSLLYEVALFRHRYSFNPAVRAPPCLCQDHGIEGKYLRLKVGDRHLRHHSLFHSIYTIRYTTLSPKTPAIGFILPVIRAVSTNPRFFYRYHSCCRDIYMHHPSSTPQSGSSPVAPSHSQPNISS